MIKVTFSCGHSGEVEETASNPPSCHCGNRAVTAVKARAPRFRGACSGPYAEACAVQPAVVDLTTSGPLKLKKQD